MKNDGFITVTGTFLLLKSSKPTLPFLHCFYLSRAAKRPTDLLPPRTSAKPAEPRALDEFGLGEWVVFLFLLGLGGLNFKIYTPLRQFLPKVVFFKPLSLEPAASLLFYS